MLPIGGKGKTMDFRPLYLEDRAWITKCRDTQAHPFTALSFPSLYSWRNTYGFTVAGDADFFVIRSVSDGGYYCPCGDPEKCRMFLENLEAPAKVLYLTEQQAAALEGRGWTVRHRDDLSEYIVSTAAEALREGHISKSFRDKCRRFKNRYTYTVDSPEPEQKQIMRKMLATLRLDPEEEVMGDLRVLATEIEDGDAMGMRSYVLQTEGEGNALFIGYENRPDMFTMTMVKHDPTLPPEITAVCVHELALKLDGEYEYINLEEDLGLEGLRRAKALYSPVVRLEVYEASRE